MVEIKIKALLEISLARFFVRFAFLSQGFRAIHTICICTHVNSMVPLTISMRTLSMTLLMLRSQMKRCTYLVLSLVACMCPNEETAQ